MNMLNMLDKKMMNNTHNNNIPSQRYNPNPFQMMSNSKPYQNTEDVLQQIQSIIQ